MTEKKIAELIQREIDGALSPAEESLLRDLLTKDARAAELSASLRSLSRILGSLNRQDPPPTLKLSIMRAVEAPVSVSRPRRASITESISSFLRGFSPRGAFTGGLVAGLGLALVAFVALVPSTIQETDLVGTALLTESVPVMAPTARVSFVAGDVSGSLTMESSGKFQMATILLASGGSERSAVLSYRTDQVHLAAVRPEGAGSIPLAAGRGLIEIRHQGRTRVELLFTVLKDQPAPLRLTVRTADGAEHNAEIAFASPASR